MMADHNLVFWRCRNKEPHSSGFLCRVVLSGTKSRQSSSPSVFNLLSQKAFLLYFLLFLHSGLVNFASFPNCSKACQGKLFHSGFWLFWERQGSRSQNRQRKPNLSFIKSFFFLRTFQLPRRSFTRLPLDSFGRLLVV